MRAVYIHGLLWYVRWLIIYFYLVLDVMYLYEESYDCSWGKVEFAHSEKRIAFHQDKTYIDMLIIKF